MKTLTNMTPDEHNNCLGMWCYIFDQTQEMPIAEGIIAGYRTSDNNSTTAVVVHPYPHAEKWRYALHNVAPRFDIPRAWNTDGTPPTDDTPTH